MSHAIGVFKCVLTFGMKTLIFRELTLCCLKVMSKSQMYRTQVRPNRQ